MEKSPYDISSEEAFYRNQRQLKEEMADYQKNIELIDQLLIQMETSMDEVRNQPTGHLNTPSKEKKVKRFPQKNWVKI